ncbi:MAG: tRNA uridine-5-carboxymethylaminomethyl(34) synthesis enzyme MnmG [Acidobacteriota bacterium]|jgi:tRNA uridine 5-carboxymethylaminomethyl modification enzyme
MRADVVVVGGGHAGCEAALAAARLGCDTVLVTPRRDAIARMSCNPAIGGLGKGHLVREIDALGGEMGRAADDTGIQFRLLNRSRGPAVRGPRAQMDRAVYASRMQRAIAEQPRLRVVEGLAAEVLVHRPGTGRRVAGIALEDGGSIACRALVITSGTFLRGRLHVGTRSRAGGRIGEPASTRLSDSLAALGLRRGRLKTGTSPRLSLRTIDLDRLEAQSGDPRPVPFSFGTATIDRPQIACFRARTVAAAHDLVREHLHLSPLFNGAIDSRGPRYCPSLEDKVVRFPDRASHPLILEPEGYASDVVYVNGLSTSLPERVQRRIVRSLPGLEDAEVLRAGYLVEYDFFDPRSLGPDLAAREIPGLFLAGQIDGTTGYEEAAGLGLLAGINAAARAGACPSFIPGREEGYLGVMVDDLITRGAPEPYRMFTSRAEHRLLLDVDSADRRLTPHGRRIGLVDDTAWERYRDRRERSDRALAWLGSRTIAPSASMRRRAREEAGLELGERPIPAERLLARDGVAVEDILALLPPGEDSPLRRLDGPGRGHVECRAKYGGYLKRQEREIRRLAAAEARSIPAGFRYRDLGGISAESVEKLEEVRPRTLGQASRIPGLTPAALAALDVHLARAERAAEGDVPR